MAQSIQLYLVSGFLGAGKTTFMRSMIENFAPKKLGVLVNEFGSIGVDGTLVNKSGLKLVEINDGSVFCACLKDGFARTLKAFSEQDIDCLLIECSGMADPSAMGNILEGLSPYFARPFSFQGSICLVDCTTFLDYVDVLMPVQNQVATADLILVNKTDLVDEATLAEVHRFLQLLNKNAYLHNTTYAQIPFALLEAELAGHREKTAGEDAAERSCANTPASRPATYTLAASGACTKQQLHLFYADIMPKMLRMKGFIRSEEGWWHVEAVAKQFTVEPAGFDVAAEKPDGAGKLVLISSGKEDIRGLICEAWKRNCPSPMELQAT